MLRFERIKENSKHFLTRTIIKREGSTALLSLSIRLNRAFNNFSLTTPIIAQTLEPLRLLCINQLNVNNLLYLLTIAFLQFFYTLCTEKSVAKHIREVLSEKSRDIKLLLNYYHHLMIIRFIIRQLWHNISSITVILPNPALGISKPVSVVRNKL